MLVNRIGIGKKSKNNYTLYIVIKCLYVVECGEK